MIDGRGVYALVLSLPTEKEIRVGRLGSFRFPAGFYLYFGSAQGPGGLRSRLERHCRMEKKLHWHIDYLRLHATLTQLWFCDTDERLECRWATAGARILDATVPAPRFGASDCRCPSHLYCYPQQPDATAFAVAARS